MPAERVVFTHRARLDLRSIGTHSARTWGREQTRRYLRAIRSVAEERREFPERWPLLPTPTHEMRKVRSGSHILIYRVTETAIEIIRVLHERQDVPEEYG